MAALLAGTTHARPQPMPHAHRDMRWREAVTALAVLGLRTSPASIAGCAQARGPAPHAPGRRPSAVCVTGRPSMQRQHRASSTPERILAAARVVWRDSVRRLTLEAV